MKATNVRAALLAIVLALGGFGCMKDESGGQPVPSGTGGETSSRGGSDVDAADGGTGGMSMSDGAVDLAPDGGPDAAGGDAVSDGGGDGSNPDAVAAYNPCPAGDMPCVIMPVGDSITQGVPDPGAGGYRVPLFRMARMNGKSITFVGSGADGPAMVDAVAFPRAHEGHSGFNIEATQGRQGIAPFFPGAITTHRPHIVLLMIGTNDVDTNTTDIPMRLGSLMDSILGADPNLLLVVAQIIPQQRATPDTLNMRVEAFNAAIPDLVKTRADAGKHVRLVDMYSAFTAIEAFSSTFLADRLHPTAAGFAVMAKVWYGAIGSFLR